MKIKTLIANTTIFAVALCGYCPQAAQAQVQLSYLVDFSQTGVTDTKNAKGETVPGADLVKAASKTLTAKWASTFQGEQRNFEGYFIATSGATKMAVRSDDGVTIVRNSTRLLFNYGTGQHWPNDASFADLGGGWPQNVPQRVTVEYGNVKFSGNDADGISLFPYNGTGKVVTVDLSGGVNEFKEDLSGEGVFIPLNDDGDENKRDAQNQRIADNALPAGILENDNELRPLTLNLAGQGESGKWSLTFSSGLKLWRQQNGNWVEVVSGTEYGPVTLPQSIALKAEGVAPNHTMHDVRIDAALKLTTPAAAEAITTRCVTRFTKSILMPAP